MRSLIALTVFLALIGAQKIVSAAIVSYGNTPTEIASYEALPASDAYYYGIQPMPGDTKGQMKTGFDVAIHKYSDPYYSELISVRDVSDPKGGNAGFDRKASTEEGAVCFGANTMHAVEMCFNSVDMITAMSFVMMGHDNNDDWIRVTAYLDDGSFVSLLQNAPKHEDTFYGFSTDTGYFTKVLFEMTSADGTEHNRNGGFDLCGELRDNGTPTATPEPATLLIFGIGLAGIPIYRRRFFHSVQ